MEHGQPGMDLCVPPESTAANHVCVCVCLRRAQMQRKCEFVCLCV